jgi:probable HAF family extracellular repeat protein
VTGGGFVGVNNNNHVVGGTGMCGNGPGIGGIYVRAVLWQNNSVTDLGNLGGAVNNAAYAINNWGQIVGASDLASDNTGHAFLWQDGVMADFGTLTGDFSSAAFGINNKGQAVGQSCNSDFSVCRAFLWQTGAMTDLNALIPAGSSLFVISGDDINDSGEIVGIALDQNGVPVAFQVVPCDEQHVGEQGCQDDAQSAIGMERPKVVLPESVRRQLQHRMRFGRL